jgi:pyruvate-formate lyase
LKFDIPVSERIQKLKAKREWSNRHLRLNTERNRIITEYYKTHENEYPILKRAGYLYTWCATREISIEDDDIFLGGSGPWSRTLHFDIEATDPLWIPRCFGDTDENFRAAWQVPGCVWVDDEEREYLLGAAKYWEDKDISSHVRGLMMPDLYEKFGNGVIDADTRSTFITYQGHFIPNFERAVHVGFGAVRRTAVEKLAEIDKHITTENARSHPFYRAIIKTCDAVILMSRRYAEGCREKAKTAAPQRRDELLGMADSCDWIMEHPARNLWEGFQTMFFYQYLISADGAHVGDSPARVDKYIGDLLENDIRNGTLTREQAQELCDAYLLHIGDQIVLCTYPANEEIIGMHKQGRNLYDLLGKDQNVTGGMNITLGGMKPDGTGQYNLATEMLMLSYYRLRVAEPSVALRVNKDTPDRIWALGIEMSKRSGGIPQFNNDEQIIQTMVEKGRSLEDARDYGIVGCVEPAICGSEWPFVGSAGHWGGFGLIPILNMVIYGNVNLTTGVEGWVPCKKLYEYESFEELQAEFKHQVQYYLDYEAKIYQLNALVFNQAFPCLSASVMTEGCLESGKDVTWGGAKYYAMGAMTRHIAECADSLMVIKKLCFEDKTVALKELYDALCANWVGYEKLRQNIINSVTFYGNDNEEVDDLARWSSGLWLDYYNSRCCPFDGVMNGGVNDLAFVLVGKGTAASPDGRRAGESLSQPNDPRQSVVMNGPLSYIKSVARLPFDKFRCGGAINLRFDANSVLGDEATGKIRDLIESFFGMGGIQFHFTVADTAILHAAQIKPQDYQDLIVRIAGFSAYFTHLPFEDQVDYITRCELTI